MDSASQSPRISWSRPDSPPNQGFTSNDLPFKFRRVREEEDDDDGGDEQEQTSSSSDLSDDSGSITSEAEMSEAHMEGEGWPNLDGSDGPDIEGDDGPNIEGEDESDSGEDGEEQDSSSSILDGYPASIMSEAHMEGEGEGRSNIEGDDGPNTAMPMSGSRHHERYLHIGTRELDDEPTETGAPDSPGTSDSYQSLSEAYWVERQTEDPDFFKDEDDYAFYVMLRRGMPGISRSGKDFEDEYHSLEESYRQEYRDKLAKKQSSTLSNAVDGSVKSGDDSNRRGIQSVAVTDGQIAVDGRSPVTENDDLQMQSSPLCQPTPPIFTPPEQTVFSGSGSATTTPERARRSISSPHAGHDNKTTHEAPPTIDKEDPFNEKPSTTPGARLQTSPSQTLASPVRSPGTQMLRDAWAMSQQQNVWLQAKLISAEEEAMNYRHALSSNRKRLEEELKVYGADAKEYKKERKEMDERIATLQKKVEKIDGENQDLLDKVFQKVQDCREYCTERKKLKDMISELEEQLRQASERDELHRKLRMERHVLMVRCSVLEEQAARLKEDLEKTMALLTVQGQLEKEFEKELHEFDERREQEQHSQSPEGHQESFMVCNPMTHWHAPPEEPVQVPGICTYTDVSITIPIVLGTAKDGAKPVEQKNMKDGRKAEGEERIEVIEGPKSTGTLSLKDLKRMPTWLLTIVGLVFIFCAYQQWEAIHERNTWLAANGQTVDYFWWWYKLPSFPSSEDRMAKKTFRMAVELQRSGQLRFWG